MVNFNILLKFSVFNLSVDGIQVWLTLLVAAIPLGALGLAFVDYKESISSANIKFETFFETYLMFTIKTLMLQQGNI